MGAYDYEYYNKKKSIFPVKSEDKISMLEEMIGSGEVIPDLRPSFANQIRGYFDDQNDYTKLFNRSVFKISRLREDVYLFNTLITNFENNDINSFVFAVNSRTIFRRFRVYKKDEIQPYPIKDLAVRDFINLLLDSQNRITLHFWKNEQELIETNKTLTNFNFQYYKFGLFEGMPINITNYTNYNKRLLIGIINETNLLQFNNPSSDSYFNDELFEYYK